MGTKAAALSKWRQPSLSIHAVLQSAVRSIHRVPQQSSAEVTALCHACLLHEFEQLETLNRIEVEAEHLGDHSNDPRPRRRGAQRGRRVSIRQSTSDYRFTNHSHYNDHARNIL